MTDCAFASSLGRQAALSLTALAGTQGQAGNKELGMKRRQFLQLAAAAAALPTAARYAWAQSYPTQPIRILVGYAAGGGVDIVARLLGEPMKAALGQPVLVENRTGA